MRRGANFCRESRRVFMPYTEAAHPRVDFEVNRNDPVCVPTHGLEARHFLGARNGGGEVVVGECRVFLRQQRAQHQNWPAGTEFAQRGGLGDVGYSEQVRAGVHELPRRPGAGRVRRRRPSPRPRSAYAAEARRESASGCARAQRDRFRPSSGVDGHDAVRCSWGAVDLARPRRVGRLFVQKRVGRDVFAKQIHVGESRQ